MKDINFRNYLLLEQKEYLGHRVGDVLTAIQDLIKGGKQVGARHKVRYAEAIVIQIRKILHQSWPTSEHKYLKKLQKCGVGLMKAIDEKEDLDETLNSVKVELENLSEKLGSPVHHMGTPSDDEGETAQVPEVSPQPAQEMPPPDPRMQQ